MKFIKVILVFNMFIQLSDCDYAFKNIAISKNYVDKTNIIQAFLDGRAFVLVTAPRRFGKTINLDTLITYFQKYNQPLEDLLLLQLQICYRNLKRWSTNKETLYWLAGGLSLFL